MVPFATPCLATEGLKKVNMSGDEEQFVINVANSLKHPKFNAQIDGKNTISSLLVPIARQTGDKKTSAPRAAVLNPTSHTVRFGPQT